jgi:hypothetical protein
MSMRLLLKDRHIYLCGHLAVILGGSEPLWRLLSGKRVFSDQGGGGPVFVLLEKSNVFTILLLFAVVMGLVTWS